MPCNSHCYSKGQQVGSLDNGTCRIWIKSQWGLDHAAKPWARVKGPMGAAQLHVGEMQWRA
eukprot:11010324-Karenia_brevis.AAC.1